MLNRGLTRVQTLGQCCAVALKTTVLSALRAATLDLLEDGKSATAAALAEGIVPGAGIALVRAEKALKKVKDLVGDEKAGGFHQISGSPQASRSRTIPVT